MDSLTPNLYPWKISRRNSVGKTKIQEGGCNNPPPLAANVNWNSLAVRGLSYHYFFPTFSLEQMTRIIVVRYFVVTGHQYDQQGTLVNWLFSELTSYPSDVYAFDRGEVVLNCATDRNSTPVDWRFKRYGSPQTETIYESGFFKPAFLGRHSMGVLNSKNSLQISNIRQEDAGTYICIDLAGMGERAQAELIVIGDFVFAVFGYVFNCVKTLTAYHKRRLVCNYKTEKSLNRSSFQAYVTNLSIFSYISCTLKNHVKNLNNTEFITIC